jgi:hypothetical protein
VGIKVTKVGDGYVARFDRGPLRRPRALVEIPLPPGELFTRLQELGYSPSAVSMAIYKADRSLFEIAGPDLGQEREAGIRRFQFMPEDADIPEPRDAAAYHALKQLPSHRVPWFAAAWLVEGLDSDSLRQLAGLDGKSWSEVEELFIPAMAELGVDVPVVRRAQTLLLNRLARLCLEGRIGERAVTAIVYDIWITSDYDDLIEREPLGAAVNLDDSWEYSVIYPEFELRTEVQRLCRQQLGE